MAKLSLFAALVWALSPVMVICLPGPTGPSNFQADHGVGSRAVERIPYALKAPPLDTEWTSKVGTNPWPQHPRPRLVRDDWVSLNGIWAFEPFNRENNTGDGNSPPSPPQLDSLSQEVLVPSCIESGISGIMQMGIMHMWYARTFNVPSDWKKDNRVILIFEAVDYEATVYVNGQQVSFNRGGYFRFSIDVTQYVKFGETNDLQVFVFDPTDLEGTAIPRGKQVRQQDHIWYTPCSGIWQSVWLESVPEHYVTELDIAADMNGEVSVTVHTSRNESVPVEIALLDGPHGAGNVLLAHKATSNQPTSFRLSSPKLWSPDSPNLYHLIVKGGDDEVRSYTGFRTFEVGTINGIKRPLLNGKFVFQFGTLDQGFWPDGIYTPPTLEAMVWDLQLLKSIGMNMVRKHIKIEPDLFYEACDKLGLIVIQDMPSVNLPNEEQQVEFERQVELMVNQFKGYPSIGTWVIYNEGWGQLQSPGHPEFAIAERIRQLDPTRLIDAVTGWHDFGDNHHYAEPQCGTPWYSRLNTPYDPARIGFQGEYGGIGHIPPKENLWPVQAAIDKITETYEINANLESYHYRAHKLFELLTDQVKLFACSGAVYTQTTDVEGEVNGLVTYDRRFIRIDKEQWKKDIKALYDAAAART
ncbi:Glycoside hydrolase superfamily [Naviculisporaceae sp. PSN 640]